MISWQSNLALHALHTLHPNGSSCLPPLSQPCCCRLCVCRCAPCLPNRLWNGAGSSHWHSCATARLILVFGLQSGLPAPHGMWASRCCFQGGGKWRRLGRFGCFALSQCFVPCPGVSTGSFPCSAVTSAVPLCPAGAWWRGWRT